MVPTASSLLATAQQIGAIFETLLIRANVKDSGEARISACLCLTIAELFGASLVVFRSPFPSHAPVLIRSMHEALADLKNLTANPDYLDQIWFENAKQTISVVKEFESDPELQQDQDAISTMAEWRAREQPIYDRLKQQGIGSMSVLDVFKKAGMAPEYGGYRFMCSFTHSNLTTLIARHAGDSHLRFAGPLPFETLKSTLGMAVSIYARAVETLPHYTDIPAADVTTAIDAANASWGPV